MTPRYKLPPAESEAPARQLFDAIGNLQALGDAEGAEKKVTLGRLYGYASGAEAGADPELERLLAENQGLRRDFRRLLSKTAVVHMPRVAAASSGEISQRSGANCRIRFEPSRAEPDQVYVIIEFTGAEDFALASLFVCDGDNRCDKFSLPAARDGIVQLLLERESELLAKLRDINTEIYLG